jgi:nucleoside-diphosphate-sugar epimerase
MGQQVAALHKIHFGWGRIFYPYGPGEDSRRLVPSATQALIANKQFLATYGKQIRDYIFVDDVASALQIMVNNNAEGIYNICSAQPVSIHDLLLTLGNIVGRPELIKFGAIPCHKWEPKILLGENNQLHKLGWVPKCFLKEGLQQSIYKTLSDQVK